MCGNITQGSSQDDLTKLFSIALIFVSSEPMMLLRTWLPIRQMTLILCSANDQIGPFWSILPNVFTTLSAIT